MTPWIWSLDGWIVAVGLLSACSCALVGNYLVLRKMSLMGDAISHAVLPGLAIAFLITHSRAAGPMFVGAVLVGVLTAVLTEAIRRHGNVEHGAAMGVVFSILFAMGLILIRQAADDVDLDPGCVLYGNIVQIPLEPGVPSAVINLSIVLGLNVLFIALFYKELKICAFDPDLATSLGINAGAMHYALMVVVAMTTVANFEAVGSILVIAMLIVPAAAAHLLTDRLGTMLAVSVVIASTSAIGGHVLALWGPGWAGYDPGISVNTAAMMAVVSGGLLVVALLLSPQHGLIARAYHRAALSMQIVRDDILGLLYRWREMRPRGDHPMQRRELLAAVGSGLLSRWALASLERRGEVARVAAAQREPAVALTDRGLDRAATLIRVHRLWEAYLAKHFTLPLDHLHMPAERVEHYISPAMGEALSAQLPEVDRDPHGKRIPDAGESGGERREADPSHG